jgi:VanZ family protein
MISRPELRWTTFWWACDWLITLGVILGSLIPPAEMHRVAPDINDKLMHAGAYFLMGMWFAGSLEPKKHGWLAIGLIALGGLIEILQYYMGFGRDADWLDFLADGLGAVLAISLARAGLGNWMAWVERRFVRA